MGFPSILFLCQSNLESFINPIIKRLSALTKTKLILAGPHDWQSELAGCHKEFEAIWLEWANELAVLMTRDPQGLKFLEGKRVVMRCHSYEVLSGLFQNVDLEKIDVVMFVAKHVRDVAMQISSMKDHKLPNLKVWTIPNGIDMDHFKLKDNLERGHEIAFVGNISHKKGFPLLLHAFRALPDSYRLHVAGEFQDYRFKFYADHILRQFGGTFTSRVKFYGKVDDIRAFLSDKHFIVSSSPWEGHPVNIIEGMAMGLKPAVHDFLGASEMYGDKWIWTTIDDFYNIVHGEGYKPKFYREFVEGMGWTMDFQMQEIVSMLEDLKGKGETKNKTKDEAKNEAKNEVKDEIKVEVDFDPKDIEAGPKAQMHKYDPESYHEWPIYMQKAFRWLTNHLIPSGEGVGIAVSSTNRIVYPEVTGYLIPTIKALGANVLAEDLALGVLPFQHESGGFVAPGTDMPIAFDTAQVLRGLTHVVSNALAETVSAVKNACRFLEGEVTKGTWFKDKNSSSWLMPGDRVVPYEVNLYAMAPFIEAGKLSGFMLSSEIEVDGSEKTRLASGFSTNKNMLSHFFFYQVDGFLELHEIYPEKGLKKIAYDLIMEEISFLPTRNPFLIPAFHDVPWVCSPGQAQAAICFHKLGMDNRFKLALDAMKMLQNPSGGFYGSYGAPALGDKDEFSMPWYFTASEISWAVKFFLDACLLEMNDGHN